MATEVGQLTLKVDTGDVARATKQIDEMGNSARDTAQKIDKVTPATKTAGTGTRNLGQEAQKAGKRINDFGDEIQDANAKLKTMPTSTKAANDAMGGFGRKAGMAGVQIEQLSNQIAMGQNPIQAFGVQAADLGFILGVPLLGAVVGIGSAIASVLLPNLLKSEDASETLSNAMERLSEVIERTETGSFQLTERFVTLAEKSRELASIDLAIGIAQATIAYETATKQIRGQLEGIVGVIGPTTAAFEEINEAIRETGEVPRELQGFYNWTKEIGEEFGISREQALDLVLAFKRFQDGVIPLEDLRSEVLRLAQTGDMSRDSTRQLVSAFLDNVVAAGNAEQALEALNAVLNNTDSALQTATQHADGFAQTVGSMISVLERRDAALKNSEEALALQAAEARGASEAEKQRIRDLYASIAAEEARQEAARESAREQERAARESERTAEREARAAETKAEREAKAAQDAIDRRNQEAISVAESLLREEEAIALSYERRREAILASTQLTEEQKNELVRRLTEESNAELLELNAGYWDQWLAKQQESMTTFDDVAAGALNTFKTAAGAAFEGIIFDSENASDAVRNFAEAMGRSVINALGQMAAEWAAYYLVQSLMGKTAQAGAAAAMTANASATSLQAGISAFASTAAIPIIGPALAPGAMAAAIAATSPMVAAISTLATAAVAGRALGGQTLAGESYIVGERGPELLTMGGSNGRITPNDMLRGSPKSTEKQSSQAQLNVKVENYGSSEISVERVSESDVRIIAREIAQQTVKNQAPKVFASELGNPNSRVSQSMGSNINAQRRR
jgi:hypothetical protein